MKKVFLLFSLMVFAFMANINAAELVIDGLAGKNVGDALTIFSKWNRPSDGTAVTAADPAGSGGKSAHVTTIDYDTFFGLNVTLPAGKTIADYSTLKFDIYIGANPEDSNPNYKNMFVYIDGNAIYSSETSYPKQADLNTWTTKSYSLAGATAGNTFVLGIGMSTNKGDYYITNVRLEENAGTVPSTDYFIIADFQNNSIGDIGTIFSKWNRPTDGAVTIVADPAGSGGKCANIVTTDYDAFLGLNVTLPSGTTLDDYTDILFDIYIGANPGDSNPNYKNMFVYIDGNAIYSSETSYPKQADLNTWTTKSYSLAGATAGNTFVLGIGMSTNKGDYYITNVRLKAKTSTTPSTEYFTISDFESYTIGDIGTVFSKWNRPSDGAVTIVADPAPAGTNGKSANIVTTDYDTFLGLNVTLPSGTTLDDYTDILFDIYIGANPGDSNPNYKNMFVYIDGNAFYSSETSYPKQADLNTWTTKSYSLTGATAGNTFVLGIGMSTNTGDYYIDNVKLKAKAGTVEIIPQYTIGKSYVSNNVLFVGDAQAEKVFVYDINGKLQILKQNVSTVELDNLAKGVYIAKIIAGGQAQTIKFIK